MPDADYCEIQVGGHRGNSRRGIALVDQADAEAVRAYRWSINDKGYAVRYTRASGATPASRAQRWRIQHER